MQMEMEMETGMTMGMATEMEMEMEITKQRINQNPTKKMAHQTLQIHPITNGKHGKFV